MALGQQRYQHSESTSAPPSLRQQRQHSIVSDSSIHFTTSCNCLDFSDDDSAAFACTNRSARKHLALDGTWPTPEQPSTAATPAAKMRRQFRPNTPAHMSNSAAHASSSATQLSQHYGEALMQPHWRQHQHRQDLSCSEQPECCGVIYRTNPDSTSVFIRTNTAESAARLIQRHHQFQSAAAKRFVLQHLPSSSFNLRYPPRSSFSTTFRTTSA